MACGLLDDSNMKKKKTEKMKWRFGEGQVGLQPCKKPRQDVYFRAENPLKV